MRQLLLLLLTTLLFSQCSIFTRSYNYNNSRDDRSTETEGPRRQERPLYEPLEEGETTEREEEIEFEPGEEESETGTADKEEEEDKPESNTEAALRLQVIDYAKAYLGTKYRYGGSSPDSGFDCSGFTSYVMKQADIPLPRTSQSQEKEGKKVRLKKAKPGDLVFYRRTPVSKVFHVSLVVDNTDEGIMVIHSTSRGVVIDNITESSYWSPKISSVRDILSQ